MKTKIRTMEKLTKEEADELLKYITLLVCGESPDVPVEAINKLGVIVEQD